MTFERNVFINCPYDSDYAGLLRPMLFTILYLGMRPRIASEAMDSGQARLDKIVELITEAKYSIHDISRIEAAKAGELFRLNMTFELGFDMGCRHFGSDAHKGKKALILESQLHRYKAALSDLSGCDIQTHGNEPHKMVRVVRTWLKTNCKIKAVGPSGPSGIWAEFTQFMADNYDALIADGFSEEDISELSISEMIERMEAWLAVPKSA